MLQTQHYELSFGVEMLSEAEQNIYVASLCVASIALPIGPIAVVCVYRGLKQTHQNLRRFSTLLSVLWAIFPLTSALNSVGVLCYNDLEGVYMINQISKFISFILYYMFHALVTACCAERIIATVYYKSYERSTQFNCMFPILSVISLILSVAFSFFVNECSFCANASRRDAYVFIYFCFVVPTYVFIIGSTILLLKQNRKRRRIQCSQNVTLSDRYQTSENLRYLKLLVPMAYITTFFVVLCIVTASFASWYSFRIVIPAYYCKANLYIISMVIFWYNKVGLRTHPKKNQVNCAPQKEVGCDRYFRMLLEFWEKEDAYIHSKRSRVYASDNDSNIGRSAITLPRHSRESFYIDVMQR
uniref:G_PROTEIN_RECEP_F1_2 domain-containing protein n=1 Tax=Panagrellus redivivus TaxID=6233 RepID=A0A7E4UZ39_PANRE